MRTAQRRARSATLFWLARPTARVGLCAPDRCLAECLAVAMHRCRSAQAQAGDGRTHVRGAAGARACATAHGVRRAHRLRRAPEHIARCARPTPAASCRAAVAWVAPSSGAGRAASASWSPTICGSSTPTRSTSWAFSSCCGRPSLHDADRHRVSPGVRAEPLASWATAIRSISPRSACSGRRSRGAEVELSETFGMRAGRRPAGLLAHHVPHRA